MLDPWLNDIWTRDDLRQVANLLPRVLIELSTIGIGLWVDGDSVRPDAPIEQRLTNAVRLVERDLLALLRGREHTSTLPTRYNVGKLFDAAIVFETGIRAADGHDLDTTPGSPSWMLATARAMMIERAGSWGRGNG